jgi:hypothetical protein
MQTAARRKDRRCVDQSRLRCHDARGVRSGDARAALACGFSSAGAVHGYMMQLSMVYGSVHINSISAFLVGPRRGFGSCLPSLESVFHLILTRSWFVLSCSVPRHIFLWRYGNKNKGDVWGRYRVYLHRVTSSRPPRPRDAHTPQPTHQLYAICTMNVGPLATGVCHTVWPYRRGWWVDLFRP